MTRHLLMMTAAAHLPRPFDNGPLLEMIVRKDGNGVTLVQGRNANRPANFVIPAAGQLPVSAESEIARIETVANNMATEAPEIAKTRNAVGVTQHTQDKLMGFAGPVRNLIDIGTAEAKNLQDRDASLDKFESADAATAAVETAIREDFRNLPNAGAQAEFIRDADLLALTAITRAGRGSMSQETFGLAMTRRRKLVYLSRVSGQAEFRGVPSLQDPFAAAKVNQGAVNDAADGLMKSLATDKTRLENLQAFIQRLVQFIAVMADVTPDVAWKVMQGETTFAARQVS